MTKNLCKIPTVTPVMVYKTMLFINHFTTSNKLNDFFFTSSINGFLHIWNIKVLFPIFRNFYKNHKFIFVNINKKSNLLATSSDNMEILLLKINKSLKYGKLIISTISKNVFKTLFTYLKFYKNNNLFLLSFGIVIWDITRCRIRNLSLRKSKRFEKIIINKMYKNLAIYYSENQIYFGNFKQSFTLKKIDLNTKITNIEWHSVFSNLILVSTKNSNMFLFDIRNIIYPIQKIKLKKIIPSIDFFRFSKIDNKIVVSSNNDNRIVIIGVKNFEFLKAYDVKIQSVLIKYKKINLQNWLSLSKQNNLILWKFIF
uniref:Uncharacterized protein n=1 Tax=Lotharella vacuolata TaxID=74820 RepID=A0A0H5BHM3_9EUKA|nr:hypothetical protein [Lotharella vacuolata]